MLPSPLAFTVIPHMHLFHLPYPQNIEDVGEGGGTGTVEWMIWELKTSKWGGYILETVASITTFSLLSNTALFGSASAPYLNLPAVP